MAYERINRPEGKLFHYTRKENLEAILRDGKIRRFLDRECWFTRSVEDALRVMELTVMQEGKPYYDVYGLRRRYPEFVPEEYVILELAPVNQNGDWVRWNQEFAPGAGEALLSLGEEFSSLKAGFRGDLRFREMPKVHEVAELLAQRECITQQSIC